MRHSILRQSAHGTLLRGEPLIAYHEACARARHEAFQQIYHSGAATVPLGPNQAAWSVSEVPNPLVNVIPVVA